MLTSALEATTAWATLWATTRVTLVFRTCTSPTFPNNNSSSNSRREQLYNITQVRYSVVYRSCGCNKAVAVSDWGSGLSNGLGNDWTMLDPAIVSGQLANNLEAPQQHLGNNLGGPVRAESPPNWITANLEQLTEGVPGGVNNFTSQNNLIPAFNGLGLGGSDRGHGGRPGGAGRLGGGAGQWGAVPPPASTATPPPGFSHHRQMGGGLGGHYQGFPGVNKPSEAHKIGGEHNSLNKFISWQLQ